jgi:hypothetical protein
MRGDLRQSSQKGSKHPEAGVNLSLPEEGQREVAYLKLAMVAILDSPLKKEKISEAGANLSLLEEGQREVAYLKLARVAISAILRR